jgi:toxin FitB
MSSAPGVGRHRLRVAENDCSFKTHLLPVDEPVAVACAGLHVLDPRAERDALIAATAIVHGLTVATRNIRDFQGLPVGLVDPWRAA